MKNVFALLLLFGLLSSGYSQTFASFVVFVSDKETGLPISDATVMVKEAGWSSKTTGGDGKVFFDNSMPIGEVYYIVNKQGYRIEEGNFNIITEEKSNTLNIKLSLIRDDVILIAGKILDSKANNIAGALVELQVGNVVEQIVTDNSGGFRIEFNLNRLKYDISDFVLEVKKEDCKSIDKFPVPKNNYVFREIKMDCAMEVQNCDGELNYFLHKEFLIDGKLITNQWYVDLFTEAWVKQGIEFSGPTCSERNGKFIVSYHAKGITKDKERKVVNHFADFEVNSNKDEIIPVTELAKTMMRVIAAKGNNDREKGPESLSTDHRLGVLVDLRDGNKYKTIEINGAVWLAENLKYNTGNANCSVYNNNKEHFEKHGYLYNEQGAKIACPKGWRIPTIKDWGHLFRQFHTSPTLDKNASRLVYLALIEGGNSGLDILLSGYGNKDNEFSGMGAIGSYWERGTIGYSIKQFWDIYEWIFGTTAGKDTFNSCRCVKEQ